ncbi:ephrin type-A receptor 5-like [Petromyzon marinus]|uniref:ephrin type-A receptor 5-like n=1 Tax=Petromyzon marinus TaxID=7757 RepID=UPI003F6EF0BC
MSPGSVSAPLRSCRSLAPSPVAVGIVAVLAVAAAYEVDLLDTETAQGDLGWVAFPPDGWQQATSGQRSRPRLYQAQCRPAVPRQDKWLRTAWIPRGDARRIFLEFRFSLRRRCPRRLPAAAASAAGCDDDTLDVYYRESDDPGDVAAGVFADDERRLFSKVDVVGSGGSEVEAAGDVGPLSRGGLRLAFRDTGACAWLASVRVYRRRCPALAVHLAEFPDAPAAGDGPWALSEVTGACVGHALRPEGEPEPAMFCNADGEWEGHPGSCVCRAGYQQAGNACQVCEQGSYKETAQDSSCSRCPPHSTGSVIGATSCTCHDGYFRPSGEPQSVACAKPPSAPRDVVTSPLSAAASVTLRWSPPANPGGRSDLAYSVVCRLHPPPLRGGGGERGQEPAPPCGPAVRFRPPLPLTNAKVEVSGLRENAAYTLEVHATNGVSRLSGVPSAFAAVHVATSRDPPSPVVRVHTEIVSEDAVLLTWAEPEQPNGIVMDYEVKCFDEDDDDEREVMRLISSVPSITVTGLRHAAVYSLQVRARNAAGYGDYSPTLHFQTSPALSEGCVCNSFPPPPPAQATQEVTLWASLLSAGLVGLMLLIAAACIIVKKRRRSRRRSGHWQAAESEPREERRPRFYSVRVKMPGFRLYIDPHDYDEPSDALREFTTEIDASRIKLGRVIGAGEFGKVHVGYLKRQGSSGGAATVRVAIKTLKGGSSKQQQQDFLCEASIMGQFEHDNIVRLEGVVTKSKPVMIITEFMENHSLDLFLRMKKGHLVVTQLLGMLRDVASGMEYLSRRGYVHRDLAARNVLVSGELTCKVSDFGLSRTLLLDADPEGAYTSRGGKIPIRWTAPEAIAQLRFTSASDVWSYGIVVWEVTSYGERPYWDMSNRDVMEAVEGGWRLPCPMDCPMLLRHLMLSCWQQESSWRPSFSRLVTAVTDALHDTASLSSPAAVASIHGDAFSPPTPTPIPPPSPPTRL